METGVHACVECIKACFEPLTWLSHIQFLDYTFSSQESTSAIFTDKLPECSFHSNDCGQLGLAELPIAVICLLTDNVFLF